MIEFIMNHSYILGGVYIVLVTLVIWVFGGCARLGEHDD